MCGKQLQRRFYAFLTEVSHALGALDNDILLGKTSGNNTLVQNLSTTNCHSWHKMKSSTAKISFFFFPLLAKSITTHWAPRHANKHFAQVQPKLHCRTQAHAKLAPKQRLPWSCSQVAQHTASCTQHQDHTTQITETLRKTPRYPDKATLSRVKLSPMPTLATRLRNIIGDSTPPWGTPLLSQPSTTPGDLHLLGRNNCGRHLSLSACHLKNPSAKISVRTNAVPPL